MKPLARYRQECHRLRDSQQQQPRAKARQAVYHSLLERHDWPAIMRHLAQIASVLNRAKEEVENG